jgi:hypothetical protein
VLLFHYKSIPYFIPDKTGSPGPSPPAQVFIFLIELIANYISLVKFNDILAAF